MAGLLSKARIVARPGFNRWLVPPAALAIHLSIGQAYAFSVFKLPLTRVLGVTEPAPGDWTQTELAWIFTLAIVFLGLSAAVWGKWLERVGPRKSGVVAALCWGAGFFLSAAGVRLHQIWLLYLGYGVIGGCGLGLGYITPVSTLIKWFPDRRGLATGMAIMGFGGGAMIASPLSQLLMVHYRSPTSVGVAQTFVTLGALYMVAMLCGAFGFRIPPPDWKPAGWTEPVRKHSLITRNQVHVSTAVRTPQFWLLWAMLFLNVTAGIGILEQASPMIQEIFGGRLIGLTARLPDLSEAQRRQVAAIASGFVGLLSLFNMAGRFGWSSASDRLGRKPTYAVFFALGAVLYFLIPVTGRLGSVSLFVATCAFVLTMYGGGFATIPAYLSDMFGTQFVGAIHGRLLTAWSCAGVAGPVLVNYIREYQVNRGVEVSHSYDFTMHLMAGLLVVGFFCNLAVRPVSERYHMSAAELEAEQSSLGGPKLQKA